MTPDHCQRCHAGPDPDLRTLWHACFYAMSELGLPFAEVTLRDGVYAPKIGDQSLAGINQPLPVYKAVTTEDARCDRAFYTLLVCKSCRADWMQAIRQWFLTPTAREGCGIFVRENGANIEITREEWHARRQRQAEAGTL